MEYAIKENLYNVLIIEDDYKFMENIEIFNKTLCSFLFDIPDYDLLLLHYSIHGPPIILKTNYNNLYKNLWSQSAAAFLVNNKFFNTRLSNLNKVIKYNKGPCDFYWNENKVNYNIYALDNLNGSQIDSYSDIEKK